MAITMQGAWTVSVKSKNAAFAQRFIVTRPGNPDIIVDGVPGNSVFVSVPQWSINVQSRAGSDSPGSTPSSASLSRRLPAACCGSTSTPTTPVTTRTITTSSSPAGSWAMGLELASILAIGLPWREFRNCAKSSHGGDVRVGYRLKAEEGEQ